MGKQKSTATNSIKKSRKYGITKRKLKSIKQSDKQSKIALVKKFNKLQENSKDNSRKSGIKLMNKSSLQNRLNL